MHGAFRMADERKKKILIYSFTSRSRFKKKKKKNPNKYIPWITVEKDLQEFPQAITLPQTASETSHSVMSSLSVS